MSVRFARKVHWLTRHVEAGHRLLLTADPTFGNAEWMRKCMAQEFAGLGYDADELTNLFRSPAYPMPHQLLDYFGPAEIFDRRESNR